MIEETEMPTGFSIGDAVERLFNLKEAKKGLEEQVKEINKAIDEIEYGLIRDMETEGLDKVSGPRGTVSRSVKLYPRIESMESFMEWCVSQGRFDMIQKRVNEGSFREYFDKNNEYPDGLDAFEKSTLNVRAKR